MDIIITIIITALVANGMWLASEEGQILYPLQKLGQKLPVWIGKPLILCITCMAGSVYNVLVVILYAYLYGSTTVLAIVAHIVLNGLGAAFLATAISRATKQTRPCVTGECSEL